MAWVAGWGTQRTSSVHDQPEMGGHDALKHWPRSAETVVHDGLKHAAWATALTGADGHSFALPIA